MGRERKSGSSLVVVCWAGLSPVWAVVNIWCSCSLDLGLTHFGLGLEGLQVGLIIEGAGPRGNYVDAHGAVSMHNEFVDAVDNASTQVGLLVK